MRRFRNDRIRRQTSAAFQRSPFSPVLAGLTGTLGETLVRQELQSIEEEKRANKIANSMRFRNNADLILEETMLQLSENPPENFEEEFERIAGPRYRDLLNKIPDDENREIVKTDLNFRWDRKMLEARKNGIVRRQQSQLNEYDRFIVNAQTSILLDPFDLTQMETSFMELDQVTNDLIDVGVLEERSARNNLNEIKNRIRSEMVDSGSLIDIDQVNELLEKNRYGFDANILDDQKRKLSIRMDQIQRENEKELFKIQILNTASYYNQIRNGQLDHIHKEFEFFMDKFDNGEIAESQVNQLSASLFNRKESRKILQGAYNGIDLKLENNLQLTREEAEAHFQRALALNSELENPLSTMDVLVQSTIESKTVNETGKLLVSSAARAQEGDDKTVSDAINYISALKENNPLLLNDFANSDLAVVDFIRNRINRYDDFTEGFRSAIHDIHLQGTPEYDFRLNQVQDTKNPVYEQITEGMDSIFTVDNPLMNMFDTGGPLGIVIDTPIYLHHKLFGAVPDRLQQQLIREEVNREYAITGDIDASVKSAAEWFHRNYAVRSGRYVFKPLDRIISATFDAHGSTWNTGDAWQSFKDVLKPHIEKEVENAGYSESVWGITGLDTLLDLSMDMSVIGSKRPFDTVENIVVFEPTPNTRHKKIPDYFVKIRKKDDPNSFIYPFDENGNEIIIHGSRWLLNGQSQPSILESIRRDLQLKSGVPANKIDPFGNRIKEE